MRLRRAQQAIKTCQLSYNDRPNTHWKGGPDDTKRLGMVRAPRHDRAGRGYVFEHILVMEEGWAGAYRKRLCTQKE